MSIVKTCEVLEPTNERNGGFFSVNFLFKHGVSTYIEDCSGSTPVDLACQYNKEEAVYLLEY